MADIVLAKLAIQIAANTVQLTQGLRSAENQFKSFTNNINKAAGALGIGLGAAQLFQVISSGIGVIRDFEKEMSTVRAITGATGKEFDTLRNSALKLGSSTRYTAQQVAELQVEYGRLGFTTAEILAAEKATLDLATATGEDLAKSADVAGSTIRGFGLNASEAGRVVDVMAESFNKSALSLENFSEAMKYVAPIASQAGISIEETTALLGTLADAGIRGSQAGTSLRKIITDLGGESGTLSEKLKKLADKGLTGSEAMSEVGRTAYASLLILAKNTEKTEALTVALNDAAGAGKKAADIMGDNLAGDVTKLSTSYDALILSNSAATSIMREFIQAMTGVLQSINVNNGALGKYISNWLKLALVVPRTVANTVSGLAELFTGTAKLTEQQVQSTLKTLNDLRNEAKLKGNQDDVIIYTKLIAELTSQYGLLKDKAIDFKEADPTKASEENAKKLIVTLDSLQEKLKELKDQFGKIDASDSKGLGAKASEINNVQAQIKTIEDLINANKKRLTGIEALRERVKQLTNEYYNSDENDKKRLNLISQEINGIVALIDSLEKLKKKRDESVLSENSLPFMDTRKTKAGGREVIPINESLNDQIEKGLEKLKKSSVSSADVVTGALFRIKTEWISLGDIVQEIGGILESNLEQLAVGIGEVLGSLAIGTGSFADFGNVLLKQIGKTLTQLGELLIATGVGIAAFKKSLTSLNPAVAIAAGIALVALGAAISGSIKSLGSSSGGGSSSSGSSSSKLQEIQYINRDTRIYIEGEFRLDNKTLVAAIDKQTRDDNRIKPRGRG